jgi:acyl carrier protein
MPPPRKPHAADWDRLNRRFALTRCNLQGTLADVQPGIPQMQPSTPCNICNAAPATTSGICERCAGLLKWVREYYADLQSHVASITPATTFDELGTDSLDYIDWTLEAEKLFKVVISQREAERCHTVGDFVQRLSLAGATWGSDRAIVIEKGFLGVRSFEAVEVPSGGSCEGRDSSRG